MEDVMISTDGETIIDFTNGTITVPEHRLHTEWGEEGFEYDDTEWGEEE